MNFQFIPELVITDVELNTQSEVIYKLGQLLSFQGYVPNEYASLVLEREKVYPTGLETENSTIAMPHAFAKGIQGNHVAIGILKNPVSFNNMADTEEELLVEIVFMLAISENHKQMEMLKIVMKIFKDEKLLKAVKCSHDSKQVCDILNGFIADLKGEKE